MRYVLLALLITAGLSQTACAPLVAGAAGVAVGAAVADDDDDDDDE